MGPGRHRGVVLLAINQPTGKRMHLRERNLRPCRRVCRIQVGSGHEWAAGKLRSMAVRRFLCGVGILVCFLGFLGVKPGGVLRGVIQ